jgi:hypothetical protein
MRVRQSTAAEIGSNGYHAPVFLPELPEVSTRRPAGPFRGRAIVMPAPKESVMTVLANKVAIVAGAS